MEKAGCGCAKCREKMEKYCGKEREDPFHDAEPPVPIPGMEKLSGNQDRIDANKDGKITAEDFKRLREGDLEKFGIKYIDDTVKQYARELMRKLGKRLGQQFAQRVKNEYKTTNQPITKETLERNYRAVKPISASEIPRSQQWWS